MMFHSNIEQPSDGWLRFRFTGDGGEIDVVASYIPHDSFYEFVTAVQSVFEYGGAHDVRFNEEPQVLVLKVEKHGEKLALLLKDRGGILRGRVEADFRTGCHEIVRNLNDLGEYERFAEEWRHKPPRDRIRALWAKVSATT